MKLSSFSVILTFVILMIIGVALAPLIDVGTEPTPRQGKRMTIKYEWPHVSAKVVEQNLTSPIEGMVSALKGVESVSSKSYFGKSEIVVNLKENVDVSSVRFEISSLLRQSHERLPKGVSYPTLMGGEVVSGMASHNAQKLLLTYLVNADIQPELIKNFVKENVVRQLEAVDGVNKVEVTGTTDTYVEISYDPMALSAYGITSNDIADGIRNYMGQDEIIGTVMNTTAQGNREKIALHLTTELFGKPLGEMPLKNIDGKVVYLNDLAAVQVKNQDPDSYYRVNGLNTVYINVYIPSDGKTVRMSDVVQEKMEQLKAGIHQKVYFQLSYDSAKQQREEMSKLLRRTLMSLAILLVFVWLTNRDWKYLVVIASTLAANLLIAIIVFWLFDIQLHIYSLAGITVSLGLIIDSTIVMVDHYGYYHNRKAFLSLLAAMLTTIGSMVVIFFLPKELQQDLYDFAWIVIINLVVSLVVALFLCQPSLTVGNIAAKGNISGWVGWSLDAIASTAVISHSPPIVNGCIMSCWCWHSAFHSNSCRIAWGRIAKLTERNRRMRLVCLGMMRFITKRWATLLSWINTSLCCLSIWAVLCRCLPIIWTRIAAGVMRMRKRYCTSEHRCLWAVQPCSLTPR